MSSSDNTVRKQLGNLTPFKPGESGNPDGRPKGARSKLSERFLAELLADFEVHGADAIVKTREADPAAYIRVIASLLPREIKAEALADLTDEQIDARIRLLLQMV